MPRYHAFPDLIQFTHTAVQRSLTSCLLHHEPEGSPLAIVDATCGNGHDTLFIAEHLPILVAEEDMATVGLYAFDVQGEGLERAREKLSEAGLGQLVTFIHDGHEHIDRHLPPASPIAVAMYNLGYLPGSDKTVVTRKETTLHSFTLVSERMMQGGLLAVHAYGGHDGGSDELAATSSWFCSLPQQEWAVLRYEICNKDRNPEVLYLAEKL